MAGLYDSSRGAFFGGLKSINENLQPGTKKLTDLDSGDVKHLVATHWALPDLVNGFHTIDGEALLYFSDVSLQECGIIAKSTRKKMMQDLREFRRHGIPFALLPEEAMAREAKSTPIDDAPRGSERVLPVASPRTRTPSPTGKRLSMVHVVGSEGAFLDGVYHAQEAGRRQNRATYRHCTEPYFFYVNRHGQWTLTMFESDIEVNRGTYRATKKDAASASITDPPPSPDLVDDADWEMKPDIAKAKFLDSGNSLVFESMKNKGHWRPAVGFRVHAISGSFAETAPASAFAEASTKLEELSARKVKKGTASTDSPPSPQHPRVVGTGGTKPPEPPGGARVVTTTTTAGR